MSLRRSVRLSTSTPSEQASKPSLEQNGTSTPKPVAQSKQKGRGPGKVQNNEPGEASPPQTPQKKRRRVQAEAAAANPPGLESLPPNVGMIAEPASLATPRKRKTRPAEPHVANALLKTPKRSRVAAYPPRAVDEDPLPVQGVTAQVPKPSTTTDNLLEQACAHLVQVDPKLRPLIEQHRCRTFSPEGLQEEIDPFTSLASSVISQQVSSSLSRIAAVWVAVS